MVGNGRAEGLAAIGDRGQATNSPTPDVDGTDSGSLLDSILSTPVKKRSSDVWFVALFFFFSPHRWHGSTGLHSEQLPQPPCTILHSGPVLQNMNSASWNEENPLALSCIVNLFGSSVSSSSSCLSSSFLWASDSIRSSSVSLVSSSLHTREFNEVILL